MKHRMSAALCDHRHARAPEKASGIDPPHAGATTRCATCLSGVHWGSVPKNPTARIYGAADFRTSVKPKFARPLLGLLHTLNPKPIAGCNFACVTVAMLLHRVGSAAKLQS